MERINTGEHSISTRICANPPCDTKYAVQHGGQKSGGSPVVHVPKIGEQPVGYCSSECLFENQGWDYQAFQQDHASLTGVEPRGKGQLAPARRPENNNERG